MTRLLLKLFFALISILIAAWMVGYKIYNQVPNLDPDLMATELRSLRPHILTLSQLNVSDFISQKEKLESEWEMRLGLQINPPPLPNLEKNGLISPSTTPSVFTVNQSFPDFKTISTTAAIQFTDGTVTNVSVYIPLLTHARWVRLDPIKQADVAKVISFNKDIENSADILFVLVIFAFALLVAILTCWYVMLRLKKLHNALKRIRAGDLSVRIGSHGRDIIHMLGNDFDAMTAQLQNLIIQQDNMLRMLAHEIRTPLARIDLGIHLSEREHGANPRLLAVHREIDFLDRLIQNLTRLIRIDHQVAAEAATSISLASEVNDVIADWAPLHPQLTLKFCNEVDFKLRTHEALVRVAILNLLGNAARFARKQIRLEMNRTPNTYIFCIDDDGVGIPVADRDNVFQPFFTIGASGGEGCGLGLTIVHRIMTSSGGTIRCMESPLGGARFVLAWPINVRSP